MSHDNTITTSPTDTHAGTSMGDHGDIQKHVRTYVGVFIALAALTAITVAVSYLHLPIHQAVALAMLIATVKGSLVACYFMHLISETKLIRSILFLTAIFFFVLMILFLSSTHSVLGTHNVP